MLSRALIHLYLGVEASPCVDLMTYPLCLFLKLWVDKNWHTGLEVPARVDVLLWAGAAVAPQSAVSGECRLLTGLFSIAH